MQISNDVLFNLLKKLSSQSFKMVGEVFSVSKKNVVISFGNNKIQLPIESSDQFVENEKVDVAVTQNSGAYILEIISNKEIENKTFKVPAKGNDWIIKSLHLLESEVSNIPEKVTTGAKDQLNENNLVHNYKLLDKNPLNDIKSVLIKLNDLGMKDTKLNREIVGQLLKNSMTVNKESVNELKQLVKKVVIVKNAILANKQMSIPAKVTGEENADLEVINDDTPIHQLANKIIKNENISLSNLIDNITKEDVQETLFLLRNKMSLTPNNLKLIKKIIYQNKDFTTQLRDTVDHLSKEGKFEMAQKIMNIFNLEDNSENNFLDRIAGVLDEVQNVSTESSFQEETLESIKDLKNSLNFLVDVNKNIVYAHIPLDYNNQQNNLEFFYNKKNKQSKSKEKKIYISLDTNNLDKVQVLIDYKPNELSLDFRMIEGYRILQKNQEVLASVLESLGFSNVKISFHYKEKNDTIMDIMEELNVSDSYTFDMKV